MHYRGSDRKKFIRELVAPYLLDKGIYLTASETSKPNQKGGDIRFTRLKQEIIEMLKSRKDLFISTFVDYYGLKEWPGLHDIPVTASPSAISSILISSAIAQIASEEPALQADKRYIPFIAVHEFEALLFCSPDILEREIKAPRGSISSILSKCGSPEQINTGINTAPSKRIQTLATIPFHKTTHGIEIAKLITINTMRTMSPLFDAWLKGIESL